MLSIDNWRKEQSDEQLDAAIENMHNLEEKSNRVEAGKEEGKQLKHMISDLLSDLKASPKAARQRKNTLSIKNDPFLIYGSGLHNFLRINNRFVYIFLVLAALSCVKMAIFRSYAVTNEISGFTKTAYWTFGSIGYPRNLCSKNLINWSLDPEVREIVFDF